MLGDNIKSIRMEKKLGINETARKAGISPSYLSDIEKGNKTNPSTEVLEKIANALEVDVKDFFNNESTTNEKLTEQVKYIESLELNTPEEALKLILSQPVLMAYGGYDLNNMSEEEIMDLANDMLFAMKISIEKMKRK